MSLVEDTHDVGSLDRQGRARKTSKTIIWVRIGKEKAPLMNSTKPSCIKGPKLWSSFSSQPGPGRPELTDAAEAQGGAPFHSPVRPAAAGSTCSVRPGGGVCVWHRHGEGDEARG